jgi:cytochrome P450
VSVGTDDIGLVFDPLDPAQDDLRYELLARAREHQPVFHVPKYDVWFVTRYEDVETILYDHARFSTRPVFSPAKPWPSEVQAILDRGHSWFYFLSNNDPPEHTPLKKAVSWAFSRAQTRALEQRIREITTRLVDRFASEGRAEIASALAYPLPAYVVIDVLGLPSDDMEQLKRWGDDFVTLFSDSADLETLKAAATGFVAFQDYFLEAFRERELRPRDDLLTHILQALRDDAAGLSVEDIVNVPINLMTAGHETGTLLMLEALAELVRDRQLLDDVARDPSLIPAVVEEALRYEPPVHGIFRVTTADVEVAGTTIPAGARVLLCYGSANHDPAAFRDPERFDPRRPDVAKHFSFGKGTHYCPGAPLARLEQRIALEELVARCPNLRPAHDREPVRLHHFWLRGYAQLWLEWDAA